MSFILTIALIVAFVSLVNYFRKERMSNLELYLKSKNVKSPAEVEHWIREYERESIQF